MTGVDTAPFSCVVRRDRLGYLGVATLEADPGTHHVHNTSREGLGDYLTVSVQALGTCRVSQDGRRAIVRPGDLCVIATDRRFTLEHEGHTRLHAFRVPRRAVAVADRSLHAVTAKAIAPGAGYSALVTAMLTSVAHASASFTPAVAERLAGNISDLLAAMIAEHATAVAPEMGTCGADELRHRVREYIDAHLADPGLSPERIAQSQRISVRYLHRMFESDESTVGRLIQRRRLEECARQLARRGRSGPTVAAVAGRWGFASPAHFSRAFRAAYGVSPREWRARGGAPDVEVPRPGELADGGQRRTAANSHDG